MSRQTQQIKPGKKSGIISFIRGTILTDERVTRQFPFLMFLVVLGFLLITNRNRSEKVIREIGALQDSISHLRGSSFTNSAKLMEISLPSDVIEKAKQLNSELEEPLKHPGKIEVKKLKEEK